MKNTSQPVFVPRRFTTAIQRSRGFTLIELMIVVALIGVLSMIAFPSYQQYLAKARRADVRSVLLEAGQWMERHYTENLKYDTNTAGTAIADLFPSTLKQSPREGTSAYTIAVSAAAARTYTITATRRPGGSMATDKCGDYQITNTGVKGNVNYSSEFSTAQAAASTCWK